MNPWDLSCRSTSSSSSVSTFNHSLSSSPSSSRSNSLTTNDGVDPVTTFKLQIVSESLMSKSSPMKSQTNHIHNLQRHHGQQLQFQSHQQQLHHHHHQQQQLQQQNELSTINPLPLDKKARKKDQNRRAAYNYRRKKMEEKNRMREEEMRLVYSRVCLIGYAEELEGSITYILNTKTEKISDNFGNTIYFLCPCCKVNCDNIFNLRSHLNIIHYNNTNNSSDKCIVDS